MELQTTKHTHIDVHMTYQPSMKATSATNAIHMDLTHIVPTDLFVFFGVLYDFFLSRQLEEFSIPKLSRLARY